MRTALLAATIAGVTLASCSSPDAAPPPTPSPTEVIGEAVQASSDVLAFGQTWTSRDGLEVTISKPKAFKPSKTAAGTEGAKHIIIFDVMVENKGTEGWDVMMWGDTLMSAEREATRVMDLEKDLGMQPAITLRPGKIVTWSEAWGIEDPTDLYLEAHVDYELDQETATFEGAL